MDILNKHDAVTVNKTELPPALQSIPTHKSADTETVADNVAVPNTPMPVPAAPTQTFWHTWGAALKQVLPIYIAVHMAFFVISCVSILFVVPDFQWAGLPLHTLWQSWHRWDNGHFINIAMKGYVKPYHTAFFPLFPLLERGLSFFTRGDPFIAGLIISDVATLILLTVLYQLVQEDFDAERATNTVLYLSIFPTAFFFATGYNEALFLCFALISFYNMRHGQWWLAGLFGFCAGLTRSVGILLVLPFCYEYLRQHQFNLRKIRIDAISVVLIPAAMMVFGLYCYFRFHDFLAFSHAQFEWQRQFHGPWHGILGSIKAILISSGFLSFQTLRNLLDLGPDLLVGTLIVLSFVGPWRLPRALWSYGIYAGTLYLFLQFFPVGGTGIFPLESMSRFMLEIFPAFIVMAGFAKYRMFHLNYMLISSALLFFLLTQFLTGHWVL